MRTLNQVVTTVNVDSYRISVSNVRDVVEMRGLAPRHFRAHLAPRRASTCCAFHADALLESASWSGGGTGSQREVQVQAGLKKSALRLPKCRRPRACSRLSTSR